MHSKLHRWWLYSCFAAALVAGWVGRFSVVATGTFIAIYLTGMVLIGPDDEGPGDADVDDAVEDYGDNVET